MVSVLVPAYNAEKWISDSIQSVLNQTWPRIELIVVDDGSTDQTVEIARSFKNSNVKVSRQPNSGPCVARNAAYSLAQGDFIQWLDADDLLSPNKIRSQMIRFKEYGSALTLLSGPCGTFLRDSSKASFIKTSAWQDLSPKELIVRKFTDNAHIVLHSWLISRAIAELAGPWDARLQKTDADGEYSCRLVASSDRILFVPDAHCYYRKGISGSLSATRTYIEEEELLLTLLFDHLRSIEDSEETRDACIAWLKTWATGYYLINRKADDVVARIAKSLNRPAISIPRSRKVKIAERVLGWKGAGVAKSRVGNTRRFVKRFLEGLTST